MRLIKGQELQECVPLLILNGHLEPGYTEVDIRLGGVGWEEDSYQRPETRLHVLKKGNRRDHLRVVQLSDRGFSLRPLHYLRAQTKEHFKMPGHIQGLLTLTSWAAQSGLEQSSSLTLKPGWEGILILELFNSLTYHSLVLLPEEPIAQIQFFDIT